METLLPRKFEGRLLRQSLRQDVDLVVEIVSTFGMCRVERREVVEARTQPTGMVRQTSSSALTHDSSTTAFLRRSPSAVIVLMEDVKTTRRTVPARTQDCSTLIVPLVAGSSTLDLTCSSTTARAVGSKSFS
jgi:hypothetical protein